MPCAKRRPDQIPGNFGTSTIFIISHSGRYKIENRADCPLDGKRPPRLYGGTERIVSYLTEELVNLGHEVTLFASGNSITAANLVPCVPQALRLDASVRDTIPYYMLMLDRVRQRPVTSTSCISISINSTSRFFGRSRAVPSPRCTAVRI